MLCDIAEVHDKLLSSCTAGRSWQAIVHSAQAWVAGIGHPAGCRSGSSEMALYAVQPDSDNTACPGPGNWLATKCHPQPTLRTFLRATLWNPL